MVWDKANLQGKVETRDIVKTAQKYVPEMKQKGADIYCGTCAYRPI